MDKKKVKVKFGDKVTVTDGSFCAWLDISARDGYVGLDSKQARKIAKALKKAAKALEVGGY